MDICEPVIGLEIHVELKTQSKMFCGCKNDPFYAKKPNIYTCPVCLGLPGALPVPNKKAIEWCILLGLALNCEIPLESKFDRKHYFYPDLPKGYQISQYDQPFCTNGWIDIEDNPVTLKSNKISNPREQNIRSKRIRIRRVHMEEDTGKLLRETVDGEKLTLIDFNRSGVPLVEIVTEPDISSGKEAKFFLQKLHQIIRYLKISDAEMSQGSMRLEPNISVRLRNADTKSKSVLPEYKVEVKNINSFRFVEKAIEYEIARHTEIIKRGETPRQETRGFVENTSSTVCQRVKEEANDYRYFPEPDVPPVRWSKKYIQTIQKGMPELPDQKIQKYIHTYGLSKSTADQLVSDPSLSEYFETCLRLKKGDITDIANRIINKKPDVTSCSPEQFLHDLMSSIQKEDIPESELRSIIKNVLKQNLKAVTDYRNGKTQVLGFLLGIVLKTIPQKLSPDKIQKILVNELSMMYS